MASFRGLAILTLGILALAAFPGLLTRTLGSDEMKPAETPAVTFEIMRFADLKGWASDDLAGALDAFLRSCEIPSEMAQNRDFLAKPFGGGSHKLATGEPVAGRIGDWQDICLAASGVTRDAKAVRTFFEDHFTPVSIDGSGKREGLFTGYYEPHMSGSRTRRSEAAVPLLPKPADLVSLDLGEFRDDLKGQRLAGRVVSGALRPFEDRGEIESGALGETAPPLVWIDDPVDAFFLHIQGSGRVTLDTGETLRLGYAGQNGHPYVAIGKVLVERGAMTLEDVSMQSIRAWLTSHGDKASEVMKVNTSYVFFQELEVSDPGLGPLGAGGTNLTPWRSLAVDRSFHALGVPVWLQTTLPPALQSGSRDVQAGNFRGAALERLMIAQDTGGAIRGAVRGDIFFGWDDEAEDLAGRMKGQGTMTLLLPNALAARLDQTGGE